MSLPHQFRRVLIAATALAPAVLCAFPTLGRAQVLFPTPNGADRATGTVTMCLNGSQQAVPCSSTGGSTAGNSGAWTDASYTATNTATVPTGLTAVSSRVGIDIENLNAPGGATACLNWTTTAAVSGSGCAVGSIPIFAGGARTWDQPGNVSPEAISLICAGSACPLTIKVR